MSSPTITEEFEGFIKGITRPKLLPNIQTRTLQVNYGEDSFELDLFAFNTISDLKLAIYDHFKENYAAPNNQFLYTVVGPRIQPIDFSWIDIPLLLNPIKVAKNNEINLTFVSSDGAQVNMRNNNYNDILISNKLKDTTIYLLLYKDMYNLIPGPRPLTDKQFYGILSPYFPYLKKDSIYPNPNEKENLQTIYSYYLKKKEYSEKIAYLLEEGGYEYVVPIFSGLRYLRLVWYVSTIDENIDSYFYSLDVNEVRPYIRYLPVGSIPVSKIHLKDGDAKIPNISNLAYLKEWTNEKNPTPERDFIYGKIALKSTILNLPTIYATTRILDDGTFDITIEPPNSIKKLDIRTDIDGFSSSIVSGIQEINEVGALPSIGSGNFIYGMKLPATSQKFTRKNFEKRIQGFKHIFQEISPLPKEHPFYMLRYRLVDNYTTEDNISNYLTQLSNKKVLKGDIRPEDIATFLAEEFQLDSETARKKVEQWLNKRAKLQQIVQGETKTYTPLNNTGVDIAIFQTKNIYTFHLYNIDSIATLQHILTFLSLIFIAPEEDLHVSSKDSRIFARIESGTNRNTDESDNESLGNLGADVFYGMDEEGEEGEEGEEREEEGEEGEGIQAMRAQLKEEEQEVEDEEETRARPKGLAGYFIDRLKQADRSLFQYAEKDSTKKSDKKETTYVQSCLANEYRQPAVLTQEQFDSMIDEYENDDVQFQMYPVGETIIKGKKVKDIDVLNKYSDPEKIISVLRYGSNPLKENYYICGQYYCIRDEIIVLKKDFLGTKLRRPIIKADGTEKTSKPPNTCPFCEGVLITNRKKLEPNETIIQRIYKPETYNKKHFWINLMSKSSPSGLKLPCCFSLAASIKFKDTTSGFVKKEEDEEEEYETLESGVPTFDYITTLSRIQKKYIVGEVLPLEIGDRDGPQIGLLPSPLNKIFQQDPVNIVGRIGNLQKILPDAKGFLRIGVENRTRYAGDSFLAAIAPFFLKNSAYQMKQRILEVVTPRIYIQLNYGNLLLEFYEPNDPLPPSKILQRFANNQLGVTYTDTNKLEIERVYKSYNAFKAWLLSDEPKEYRHFAMLLAQSNLIQGGNRAGITFIVIEMNEDSKVEIRCPPYGYNTELMTNNDVAFLFHHYTGIWEPIFYVHNVVSTIQLTEPFNLLFQKGRYEAWPDVVKKILAEFTQLCSGPGKTIYTPQSHIKPNTLIPLSYAANVLQSVTQRYNNFFFSGILRDSYNHIAAIVCEEQLPKKNFSIIIPVIDDGVLITTKDVYLSYSDIEPESYENTIRIYTKYILPYFTRYIGYKPIYTVKNRETQNYVGIQLQNNLFIPIDETRAISSELKTIEVDEFEWDINRNIIFENEEQTKEIEKQIMVEEDIKEVYEHLRITFGNYLAKKGGNVISYLETDIIFNDTITLNDKRMRMIRLLGPIILSWFSKEQGISDKSLLRKDCLIQKESTCTDKCIYTSENKCKIHVKEKHMGVNMSNLLMLRLFDEILRYSEKRKQLFENDLSRLVFLNEAIRIGNQYIVPENTLEWSELLRSMWAQRKSEAAKFFEEFSQQLVEKDENDYYDLPQEVASLLKTTRLKFNKLSDKPSLISVLQYFGLNESDIKYDGVSQTFSIKQLMDIGVLLKAYIIQIDARVSPPEIKYLSTVTNKKPLVVLLITSSGSGILMLHDEEKIAYDELKAIFS